MNNLEKLVVEKRGKDIKYYMLNFFKCLGYSPDDSELISQEWFNLYPQAVIEAQRKRKI